MLHKPAHGGYSPPIWYESVGIPFQHKPLHGGYPGQAYFASNRPEDASGTSRLFKPRVNPVLVLADYVEHINDLENPL